MDTGGEPFGAFVAEATPGLLRTAYLLTGRADRAGELVESVLARLWLAYGTTDPLPGDLPDCARRVLARLATSRWRQPWRRPDADPAPDADPGTPDAGEEQRLLRHLAQLTPRQRAALVLHHLDGLDDASVAAAFGCRVGQAARYRRTATTRMHDLAAGDVIETAAW